MGDAESTPENRTYDFEQVPANANVVIRAAEAPRQNTRDLRQLPHGGAHHGSASVITTPLSVVDFQSDSATMSYEPVRERPPRGGNIRQGPNPVQDDQPRGAPDDTPGIPPGNPEEAKTDEQKSGEGDGQKSTESETSDDETKGASSTWSFLGLDWKWWAGGVTAIVAVATPFIYKKVKSKSLSRKDNDNTFSGKITSAWNGMTTIQKAAASIGSVFGLYTIWNFFFKPKENEDGEMQSRISKLVGLAPTPVIRKTWWQENGLWLGLVIIASMGALAAVGFYLLSPGSFHQDDSEAFADIEEGMGGPMDDYDQSYIPPDMEGASVGP